MSRRFIATILAGSIALAGLSAQPARADSDQLGKLLLGAVTLVIIGTAIENSRQEVKKVYRTPQPRAQHKPRVHTRAVLPEYCLRKVRSNKGPRMIYGNRCMKQNYGAYTALPTSCRSRIDGPDGTRRGFKPGCLYRAGFRG